MPTKFGPDAWKNASSATRSTEQISYPCRYCGSAILQSAFRCANCGEAGPSLQMSGTWFDIDGVPPGGVAVRGGPPVSPGERGALIADDVGFVGRGSAVGRYLMPLKQETVQAAIFLNDRVDVPILNGIPLSNPLESFLECDHIDRSEVYFSGRLTVEQISIAPLAVLESREEKEANSWALWHSSDYDPIPKPHRITAGALRLRLRDSILLPGPGIPLDEIVAFRERNKKQLHALRSSLDQLAIRLARSNPDDFESKVVLEEFDNSLSEFLEEARKPNWRKMLASLDVSVNFSDFAGAIPGAIAAFGAGVSLPNAAGVVGVGALSSLAVKAVRGVKKVGHAPFEYIASIEREFS